MNLKVPGAILPLCCAILSTRAKLKTVRGGWYNRGRVVSHPVTGHARPDVVSHPVTARARLNQ